MIAVGVQGSRARGRLRPARSILGLTALLAFVAAGSDVWALEDHLLEKPPFDARSDVQRLGLRGPVRMTRTKVRFLLGNVEEITFDERGNRVKRIRTNRVGKVAEQQTWSYDAEGRISECVDSRWDDDLGISGVVSRSLFSYGEQNGVRWCERIDRDRNGAEISRTRYEATPERRTETTHDAGGAIVRAVVETFVNDERGFLVGATRVETTSEDTIKTVHEIRYDERGNALEEIARREDGSVEEHVEYVCDERGVRTEETRFYPDLPGKVHERYRNDAWGNEIEWTEYDRDGTVLRSRTTEVGVDDWGNWKSRIEVSSYRGNRWVFRIVEYHPVSG